MVYLNVFSFGSLNILLGDVDARYGMWKVKGRGSGIYRFEVGAIKNVIWLYTSDGIKKGLWNSVFNAAR